jgi:hypothetical protein
MQAGIRKMETPFGEIGDTRMEVLIAWYFLSGLILAVYFLRGKSDLRAQFSVIILTWPFVLLAALYIKWLSHKGVDRPLNLRIPPKKKLAPNEPY